MRILSIVLAIATCVTAASGDDLRPNVILFLADDMGQGDTSAYQDFTHGNPDYADVEASLMKQVKTFLRDGRSRPRSDVSQTNRKTNGRSR